MQQNIRITSKTPIFLLPGPSVTKPPPIVEWDNTIPADAELFLLCSLCAVLCVMSPSEIGLRTPNTCTPT